MASVSPMERRCIASLEQLSRISNHKKNHANEYFAQVPGTLFPPNHTICGAVLKIFKSIFRPDDTPYYTTSDYSKFVEWFSRVNSAFDKQDVDEEYPGFMDLDVDIATNGHTITQKRGPMSDSKLFDEDFEQIDAFVQSICTMCMDMESFVQNNWPYAKLEPIGDAIIRAIIRFHSHLYGRDCTQLINIQKYNQKAALARRTPYTKPARVLDWNIDPDGTVWRHSKAPDDDHLKKDKQPHIVMSEAENVEYLRLHGTAEDRAEYAKKLQNKEYKRLRKSGHHLMESKERRLSILNVSFTKNSINKLKSQIYAKPHNRQTCSKEITEFFAPLAKDPAFSDAKSPNTNKKLHDIASDIVASVTNIFGRIDAEYRDDESDSESVDDGGADDTSGACYRQIVDLSLLRRHFIDLNNSLPDASESQPGQKRRKVALTMEPDDMQRVLANFVCNPDRVFKTTGYPCFKSTTEEYNMAFKGKFKSVAVNILQDFLVCAALQSATEVQIVDPHVYKGKTTNFGQSYTKTNGRIIIPIHATQFNEPRWMLVCIDTNERTYNIYIPSDNPETQMCELATKITDSFIARPGTAYRNTSENCTTCEPAHSGVMVAWHAWFFLIGQERGTVDSVQTTRNFMQYTIIKGSKTNNNLVKVKACLASADPAIGGHVGSESDSSESGEADSDNSSGDSDELKRKNPSGTNETEITAVYKHINILFGSLTKAKNSADIQDAWNTSVRNLRAVNTQFSDDMERNIEEYRPLIWQASLPSHNASKYSFAAIPDVGTPNWWNAQKKVIHDDIIEAMKDCIYSHIVAFVGIRIAINDTIRLVKSPRTQIDLLKQAETKAVDLYAEYYKTIGTHKPAPDRTANKTITQHVELFSHDMMRKFANTLLDINEHIKNLPQVTPPTIASPAYILAGSGSGTDTLIKEAMRAIAALLAGNATSNKIQDVESCMCSVLSSQPLIDQAPTKEPLTPAANTALKKIQRYFQVNEDSSRTDTDMLSALRAISDLRAAHEAFRNATFFKCVNKTDMQKNIIQIQLLSDKVITRANSEELTTSASSNSFHMLQTYIDEIALQLDINKRDLQITPLDFTFVDTAPVEAFGESLKSICQTSDPGSQLIITDDVKKSVIAAYTTLVGNTQQAIEYKTRMAIEQSKREQAEKDEAATRRNVVEKLYTDNLSCVKTAVDILRSLHSYSQLNDKDQSALARAVTYEAMFGAQHAAAMKQQLELTDKALQFTNQVRIGVANAKADAEKAKTAAAQVRIIEDQAQQINKLESDVKDLTSKLKEKEKGVLSRFFFSKP